MKWWRRRRRATTFSPFSALILAALKMNDEDRRVSSPTKIRKSKIVGLALLNVNRRICESLMVQEILSRYCHVTQRKSLLTRVNRCKLERLRNGGKV